MPCSPPCRCAQPVASTHKPSGGSGAVIGDRRSTKPSTSVASAANCSRREAVAEPPLVLARHPGQAGVAQALLGGLQGTVPGLHEDQAGGIKAGAGQGRRV